MNRVKQSIWVVLLLSLSACSLFAPKPLASPLISPISVLPSPTPSPTARLATATPRPLPSATLLPTSTSTATPYPVLDTVRGQVVFVSGSAIEDLWYGYSNLWAMYPDGSSQRSLTRYGIGYYHPPNTPPAMIFAAAHPVVLDTDWLYQIPVPQECQQFSEFEQAPWCHGFKFSLDGRYLSFDMNPQGCGFSEHRLLDTRKMEYLSSANDLGIWMWLSDGRALTGAGGIACEGPGWLWLYNPRTEQRISLGSSGEFHWSPDRQSFVVNSSPYLGWQSTLWGYNLRSDTFIRSQGVALSRPIIREENPVWTLDSTHILYTQMSLTTIITYTSYATVTFGSRQIYITSRDGRYDRLLLDDPNHNYFLGDWYNDHQIIIRRVAYRPFSAPWDGMGTNWDEGKCILYAMGCAKIENGLLNWQSGEFVILESDPNPARHSTPTPAPIPGPNLQSAPIYRAPDGSFALYTGADGVGLWRVPTQGTPIQIIADGHHFIYIP